MPVTMLEAKHQFATIVTVKKGRPPHAPGPGHP